MEERVRCMERVTWKLTLPYVNWITNGNLLYVSRTQTGALHQLRAVEWGGRREGGSKGKGYIYIPMADSSWFDRKQQILYSNYASI